MNVEILFFWRHAICFVYPFCWVANSTLNDAGKKNLLHTFFSKLLTIYFLVLLLWCTFSNIVYLFIFFCKMSHHPHLSFCVSIVEMTYVVSHFGFEVVRLCRKRKMLAKALLWLFCFVFVAVNSCWFDLRRRTINHHRTSHHDSENFVVTSIFFLVEFEEVLII